MEKKLGIALVGLGEYATAQLAPALLETKHCYLAGIVTGTPSKINSWKEKYNIADCNIYNYQNFDNIKDNDSIDIVYVVLPNAMHKEFTIRAAQAGKHVICEKPMALNVAECNEMIDACKKADVHLSIGYRMHYEPHHLKMIDWASQFKEKDFKISAGFGFNAIPNNWRLNKKLSGGGPLMDLGIYCLQAVCYLTGKKPIAVTAKESAISDYTKFINIEETLAWQMDMDDHTIVECITSYTDDYNHLKCTVNDQWFSLSPAFNYNGLLAKKSDDEIIDFGIFSQQTLQLDGIVQSIKNNEQSKVPAEMGKRDMQIIAAIYESMATNKRVEINYKN